MMAGYPLSSKISRGLLPVSPGTTEMATLCAFRKTQSGFAAIWYGCEPTSRDQ